jgi:hypothetical protein
VPPPHPSRPWSTRHVVLNLDLKYSQHPITSNPKSQPTSSPQPPGPRGLAGLSGGPAPGPRACRQSCSWGRPSHFAYPANHISPTRQGRMGASMGRRRAGNTKASPMHASYVCRVSRPRAEVVTRGSHGDLPGGTPPGAATTATRQGSSRLSACGCSHPWPGPHIPPTRQITYHLPGKILRTPALGLLDGGLGALPGRSRWLRQQMCNLPGRLRDGVLGLDRLQLPPSPCCSVPPSLPPPAPRLPGKPPRASRRRDTPPSWGEGLSAPWPAVGFYARAQLRGLRQPRWRRAPRAAPRNPAAATAPAPSAPRTLPEPRWAPAGRQGPPAPMAGALEPACRARPRRPFYIPTDPF